MTTHNVQFDWIWCFGLGIWLHVIKHESRVFVYLLYSLKLPRGFYICYWLLNMVITGNNLRIWKSISWICGCECVVYWKWKQKEKFRKSLFLTEIRNGERGTEKEEKTMSKVNMCVNDVHVLDMLRDSFGSTLIIIPKFPKGKSQYRKGSKQRRFDFGISNLAHMNFLDNFIFGSCNDVIRYDLNRNEQRFFSLRPSLNTVSTYANWVFFHFSPKFGKQKCLDIFRILFRPRYGLGSSTFKYSISKCYTNNQRIVHIWY